MLRQPGIALPLELRRRTLAFLRSHLAKRHGMRMPVARKPGHAEQTNPRRSIHTPAFEVVCSGSELQDRLRLHCSSAPKQSHRSQRCLMFPARRVWRPGSRCQERIHDSYRQSPNAPLIFDQIGNLYGTTFFGGVDSCFANVGCGTVFELKKRAPRRVD